MTFIFNKVSFEDLSTKLEQVELWLNTIGIQTGGSRFDDVLKLNKEITEHHKANLVDELIEKHGSFKLWIALTEASDFINIHAAFKKTKSHAYPKSKLKKMIDGPYHSWDENVYEGNIEPRNTLFELAAAANLKKAGAKITGFDDVDFIFQKTPFNAQCKRLHSPKKIKDNVDEAYAQFVKKMKAKSQLKGIICLSIDKLSGRESMVLNVSSPEEIGPKMSEISNAFIAQYAASWRSFINPNLLAVLLFFHSIAIIKNDSYRLLTTCRQLDVDIIASQSFLQLYDYNLVLNLGRRLQSDI